MLRWVRAFEKNSITVSFAQFRAGVKTYLFGDHYKLIASHSSSKSWLEKGNRVVNDRKCMLGYAIISTPPKTERIYSLCMLQHAGTQ